MTQAEISKWLKAVTISLALMGIIFFGIAIPILAKISTEVYPSLAFLYYPGLIYSLALAIPCYIILFQFWKVCKQIAQNNSFSKENAVSFVKISHCAMFLAMEWFVGLLFLVITGWIKTGALMILIFGIFLSLIVTVVAAALSHLIQKAYELRIENELTI